LTFVVVGGSIYDLPRLLGRGDICAVAEARNKFRLRK